MIPDIRRIWINGRLADPKKPLVSVFDRGFLYGDGVYETLRVYGGRMYHFADHDRRLRASARGFGIAVPYARAEMERACKAVLRANRLAEATVRIAVSRGPSPLGFDPRPAGPSTVVVAAVPVRLPAPDLYDTGVIIALSATRRHSPACLDPAFKSTNNLNNILAKSESIKAGAFEAVMRNLDGDLAEGTISNVFFIRGGAVFTPSLACGILEGVTRSQVIRLARKRGLPVREGRYGPEQLLKADEAFITSTNLEILPVAAVVDERGKRRKIGAGRAGPLSRVLLEDFRAEVARLRP